MAGELKREAGVGVQGREIRDCWRHRDPCSLYSILLYGAEMLDMETAAQATERVQPTSGFAACSVHQVRQLRQNGRWPLLYGTRMALGDNSRSTSECESSNWFTAVIIRLFHIDSHSQLPLPTHTPSLNQRPASQPSRLSATETAPDHAY